jgi:glycosyltransferase involved in cell wall biosynthesis
VDRQAIVYFCSALARAGADVELVTLGIRVRADERADDSDPLDAYGIETPFEVTTIRTGLHQDSGAMRHDLRRLIAYSRYARRRARRSDDRKLVFYTKNFAPTLMLLARRMTRDFLVLLETHTPPSTAIQRLVMRNVDGVVANSHALARVLEERRYAGSVLATHQGVDLARYATLDSSETIRHRLGLPVGQPMAVYTGKIFRGYPEVEYIVRAAGTARCQDIQFVLVGGRADHVAGWRRYVEDRRLHNIAFTGFIPPANVHEYQQAADVLLLYYPSGMELNAYRSPGKLFGYMASGVPIVCADLPVLREVLGDPPAAVMVPPDTPAALADAIRRTIDDHDASNGIARVAADRVKEFTWDRRAEAILHFVERLTSPGGGVRIS